MTCCGCLMPLSSKPTSSTAVVPPEESVSLRSRSSVPASATPSSPLLGNACASFPFNSTRCHSETGLDSSTTRSFHIFLPQHCAPSGNDLGKVRASSCCQRQPHLQSILRFLP